jgi:hypothetical protein
MLKILYAAGNTINSRIQLARFYKEMQNVPCILKIAAYKKSSPKNIPIDWTLDCLQNLFKISKPSLDNDNFNIYYDQVKAYSPDLIISDIEYYTSHIAYSLNINIWQCSSYLISQGLEHAYKNNTGINSKYSFIFKDRPNISHILYNSDINFVYSHFGDIKSPPKLKNKFEWIRPYSAVGKKSIFCKHNIISATLNNNKKIIEAIKSYPDSISFTNFPYESYINPTIKNINNEDEYFCNLQNSNLMLCEGQTSFLADAYYNGKHSAVIINFKDEESVVNSAISKKQGLSSIIDYDTSKLNNLIGLNQEVNFNNIKYLHEKIQQIF